MCEQERNGHDVVFLNVFGRYGVVEPNNSFLEGNIFFIFRRKMKMNNFDKKRRSKKKEEVEKHCKIK